jgi:CrcB protein
MKMILYIAVGGAIGAVGRHLLIVRVTHWLGYGFPYGTLAVNILGSFAMGALVETMALIWSPNQEIRAFLVVGVLGAFTTFSLFSLDVMTLLNRGETMAAGLYVITSVILSIGAFFLAMTIFRHALT